MKSPFKSRTIWIAILQAILGVAVIYFTDVGEAGIALILKSALDISTRYVTTQPIE